MSATDRSRAPFGRVLTAMVTPFDADGRLDLAKAEQLADHLVALGNDGLVVKAPPARAPPPPTRRRPSWSGPWSARSATGPPW